MYLNTHNIIIMTYVGNNIVLFYYCYYYYHYYVQWTCGVAAVAAAITYTPSILCRLIIIICDGRHS